MDLSQMTCKCGGRCVLCGREHIPGKTSANTADRLVSDFRVYDDRWVISLCADCNYLKFTADPGEFLDKTIHIVRNRRSLYHLCEDVTCDNDLAHLVGQEPDYNLNPAANPTDISWRRKGSVANLESIIPHLRVTLMTACCKYCNEPWPDTLDRHDSTKSYPRSLADGELFPCCLPCNLLLGSRKLRDVLVHMTKIVLYFGQNYDKNNYVHSMFTTSPLLQFPIQ